MARLGEVATNLNFRQSNTQSAIIKDGTAEALMGLGKATVKAIQSHKHMQKTQQAMNFQADVIDRTIGARKGTNDPMYEALELGHDMQESHTEFMARIKNDPNAAKMEKEEFRAMYDEEFKKKWQEFAPQSAEGFQVFSQAALASQREALVWQAGANANFKHDDNIRIVGDRLIDIGLAPDGKQSIEAKMQSAIPESVSLEERDALVTQAAVRCAQQGNRGMLDFAIKDGLGSNAQHADNIIKAGNEYNRVVHASMMKSAYDELAALEILVDAGEYKPELGERFLKGQAKLLELQEGDPEQMKGKEYIPLAQHIRRLNKMHLTSLGNSSKLKVMDLHLKAFAEGRYTDFAEYPQAFQTKVVEEYDARLDNLGITNGWDETKILTEKMKIAIGSGQASSSLKAAMAAGGSALGLVDGKAGPQTERMINLYNMAIDSSGGKFFADSLMGSVKNARTADYLRRAQWAGIPIEQAIMERTKEITNPYKPEPKERAANAEYLNETLDKTLLMSGALSGLKAFFGMDPNINNKQSIMPQLKFMVDRYMQLGMVSSYEEAVDTVINEFEDRTTTVGTQLLMQSEGAIKDIMGLDPTYKGTANDAVSDYLGSVGGFRFMNDVPDGELDNLRYDINETANTMTVFRKVEGGIYTYPDAIPLAAIGRTNVRNMQEKRRRISEQTTLANSMMIAEHVDDVVSEVSDGTLSIGGLGLSEAEIKTMTPDRLKEVVGHYKTYKAMIHRAMPGNYNNPTYKIPVDPTVRAFAVKTGQTEFIKWFDSRTTEEQSDKSRIRLIMKMNQIQNNKILNKR